MVLEQARRRLHTTFSTPAYARFPPSLALVAFPMVLAVVFIHRFATALPLTDEWAFTKAVINLEDIDATGIEWLRRAWDTAALRFGGHWVAVPFLGYWMLADLVDFDSRLFIAITVATFAVQLAIYHRCAKRSWIATLLLSLVLFGPSHYMDFLWGFLFTFALSIVLPIVGLVILDRVRSDESLGRKGVKLAGAMAFFVLGTLSSSGGFFGFPAGVVLLLSKRLEIRTGLGLATALTLTGAGVYAHFLRGLENPAPYFGASEGFAVLTALGGTIWSMPVSIHEFGLGLPSATGAAILACCLVAAVKAFHAGSRDEIALPLSCVVFGLLALSAIAVSRPYVGNWHLSYALPAVCGAYLCTLVAWRRHGTLVPHAALSVILGLSIVGTLRCFTEYGPSYHEYIERIETYARRYLEEPDLPPPYPGPQQVTPDLVLFLSAQDHATFREPPTPAALDAGIGTRFFIDGEEVKPPFQITAPIRKRVLLTVVLPGTSSARTLVVRVGDVERVMRKVHPRIAGIADCEQESCFSGLLFPDELPAGVHAVLVWTPKL